MTVDTLPRTIGPENGTRRVPRFVTGLRAHGDRPALITDEATVSYADLADRVDELAGRLAGRRRLVLVEAANRIPAVTAYLAALRAGHVVLLAPAGDPATVGALTDAWDPDTVVDAEGRVRSRHSESRHRRPHPLHPELTLLMATSGSTGSPRLVRLSTAGIDANAAAIVDYLGIVPGDRAATTLPMHYCYGLSIVHSNLLAGAALLLDDRSVTDPAFWTSFRERRGTSLHGVPHTFDLLDRVGFAGMNLPDLRYVTQAGGRLGPDAVRRWARLGDERGWRLQVMYGQTEATARMAYLPPELAASAPEAIGVPVPGGALDVVDPDGDGVGELAYRGANVMLGYATSAADLTRGRTVETLLTGDLGRRRADGLYEVVGRRSRFVKPFGVRVDLDALETLLATHGVTAAVTGTDEGVVVATEQSSGSVDALTRAHGEHDRVATVRDLLTDRLPLPASAITVVAVDALPRRANGKLDHPAVATLAAPQAAWKANREAPSCAVRDIFARTFPGQECSDDASFVDLGGDSLTYVQVSADIERALGYLPAGWEQTPLGELAASGPSRPARANPAVAAGRAAPSRWATLESVVVLRALAIVLVVGEHTHLWSLLGGAHLLLAIAGTTFARFVLPGARADVPFATTRRILRATALIAIPSSLWIAFRASTQADVHWVDALLAGSVFHPLVQGYWFVDALVQILLVMAGLFAVPAIRRLDRAYPFGFPAAVLVATQALRLLPTYDSGISPDIYSTHLVLWLFVLGWLLQRARTVGQKWAVAGATLALVGQFFGSGVERSAIVAGGLLVLLLLPRIRVPRALASPLTGIASASLGIYLTHFALLPLMYHGVPSAVLVPLALVVGVVAWRTVTALLRGGAHMRRARRLPTAHRSDARPAGSGLSTTAGAATVVRSE